MKRILSLLCLFLFTSILSIPPTFSESSIYQQKYQSLKSTFPKPSFEVFEKALMGYEKIVSKGLLKKDQLLSIIDFSLSSNEKRLWVIDLKKKEILFHSLVAHGRNSGEEYAESFSNRIQSYQSSLGFYITEETYKGKHGHSLYLTGLEPGVNDNARKRGIVIHGADYVDPDFIKKHGRLGRSLGCPALPQHLSKKIIDTIAHKSCLFIYFPDQSYLNNSEYLESDA
ncbi:MAG: murein L,D-transpeptidase catalytic domain family protein [Luteibaculum sp.]